MNTRRILALAVAAALVGCGAGSRRGGGGWAALAKAPWDRPVRPPDEPAVPAGFATGTVRSVSSDGLKLEIEIDDGVVNKGDTVAVFMSTPEDPSPRNFTDEIRERRVATAKVLATEGGICEAEVVPDRRNAMVVPGDRATFRNP